MFEVVEAGSWSEHPVKLGQDFGWVGNRAQCESRQRGVAAGIVEGDGLAVESDVLDGDVADVDSLGGQPPGHRGRFDGEHVLYLRRIVLDVKARAEPNLDDSADQSCCHLRTPPLQAGRATGSVHQSGEDLFSVETHVREANRGAIGRRPEQFEPTTR